MHWCQQLVFFLWWSGQHSSAPYKEPIRFWIILFWKNPNKLPLSPILLTSNYWLVIRVFAIPRLCESTHFKLLSPSRPLLLYIAGKTAAALVAERFLLPTPQFLSASKTRSLLSPSQHNPIAPTSLLFACFSKILAKLQKRLLKLAKRHIWDLNATQQSISS